MARKKRINKLITLDTETIGLEGDIKRIAIYDGNKVIYGYSFLDIEPELIALHKQGFNVHVYIHNLEFDARKLQGIFAPGNVVWHQTKIINGKYATIACKKYILHDSFKLLPESLASLSKSFDLEHGKLDLWQAVQEKYPGEYSDHVDFLNRCDKDDPLYLEYLGYDVIALYELIEKLIDVSGISLDDLVKCLSTSSMAKMVFRKGYKGKEFKFPDATKTDFDILCSCKAWKSEKPIRDNWSKTPISYKEIETKIRESYCGGRTEVFTPHAEPKENRPAAWHYDINSLYPSKMKALNNADPFDPLLGALYPVGYPGFYDDPEIIAGRFNEWLSVRQGLGFIKCRVFVPKQYIPPLPVKKGKLAFMTGYLEGTWTYHELEFAINECGVKVVEWLEMIHFKKTYPVFHNFISLFSDMKVEAKENGEKALEKFTKLMQNCTYGWTGMNRDKTELQDIAKIDKYDEDRIIYTDEELGYIELTSDVKSYTIQVQIASYVTSYARLTLLSMLKRMESAGAALYYCDTDSLVLDRELPAQFVHKSKLGLWDCEGVLLEGIFLQPKVYAEKLQQSTTIKFKGVSRQKQKELDFGFYEDILSKYQEGEFERVLLEKDYLMLRSLLYSQKNNTDPNKGELRSKFLNMNNTQKRRIDYKQNRTEPWHIESINHFHSFTFKEDLSAFRLPNGSLIDVSL